MILVGSILILIGAVLEAIVVLTDLAFESKYSTQYCILPLMIAMLGAGLLIIKCTFMP